MIKVEFEEQMLCYMTFLFDSANKDDLKNFMGFYGIPPSGGFYWWTVNDRSGFVDTEEEAEYLIKQNWIAP